jgi:hypothetical protein
MDKASFALEREGIDVRIPTAPRARPLEHSSAEETKLTKSP